MSASFRGTCVYSLRILTICIVISFALSAIVSSVFFVSWQQIATMPSRDRQGAVYSRSLTVAARLKRGGLMPRIVSLIASATEIVCTLGFEDQIVGRSHEC